jgi:hypothetical protein
MMLFLGGHRQFHMFRLRNSLVSVSETIEESALTKLCLETRISYGKNGSVGLVAFDST